MDFKRKGLDAAIAIVSILMVLYHLAATQHLFFDPLLHQNLHYAFALALVCLYAMKLKPKQWYVWGVLLLLAIVSTGYVHYYYNDLINRQGAPTSFDLVIGVLLIVLALLTTWRAWGAVLPIIGLLFLFYAVTAEHWPGPLAGYTMEFRRLVSSLSIGLSGIYGNLLGTSANYIFLFLVFGAMMEVSGANKWFNDIGILASRVLRGGPAQTAVISSGLVGMVSGSAAANVGITGIFTIPLMKKTGIKPELAAAYEASASSGGQIMPPVMGATAFVMAEIIGIPYVAVLAMAALPAIFYYVALMIEAELNGRKAGLKSVFVQIDWRDFVLRAPLFIVPLIALVILLSTGRSASFAAFWSIILLLLLAYLRKETRPSWRSLIDGCVSGAKSGAEIAVVTAALAAIWVTLTGTGLGTKLPLAIESLSGGNVLIALLLVMVVSLILGAGVPTLAAYLLVAITTIPALVRMGVVPEAAHMAAFYFAIFSAVTPPFALAALVASRIAESNFMKTAILAMQMSILGLVFPFLFVFNPMLLLLGWEWLPGIGYILLTTLLTLVLAVLKTRYFLVRVGRWELVLAVLCSAALIFSITLESLPLAVLAILLFLVLLVGQIVQRRRISDSTANGAMM